MKYTVKEILNMRSRPMEYRDGEWNAKRPIRLSGIYGLKQRFKNAYGVLIGKYDVLDWE